MQAWRRKRPSRCSGRYKLRSPHQSLQACADAINCIARYLQAFECIAPREILTVTGSARGLKSQCESSLILSGRPHVIFCICAISIILSFCRSRNLSYRHIKFKSLLVAASFPDIDFRWDKYLQAHSSWNILRFLLTADSSQCKGNAARQQA